MTFYLAVLAVIVAGTAIIVFRRWLRDSRPNLDWLLNMEWWQRPLARLAIYMLKREVWQDVFEAAGFAKTVKGQTVPTRGVAGHLRQPATRAVGGSGSGSGAGSARATKRPTLTATPSRTVVDQIGRHVRPRRIRRRLAFLVRVQPRHPHPQTSGAHSRPGSRPPTTGHLIETHLRAHPTAPIIGVGRGDQPIAIDMHSRGPPLPDLRRDRWRQVRHRAEPHGPDVVG